MLGLSAGDGRRLDFVESADPADVQTICVVEPQAEALAARERRERRLEGLFVRGAIPQLEIVSLRIGVAPWLLGPARRQTGRLVAPPAQSLWRADWHDAQPAYQTSPPPTH